MIVRALFIVMWRHHNCWMLIVGVLLGLLTAAETACPCLIAEGEESRGDEAVRLTDRVVGAFHQLAEVERRVGLTEGILTQVRKG